jgi:hypothetical protein
VKREDYPRFPQHRTKQWKPEAPAKEQMGIPSLALFEVALFRKS